MLKAMQSREPARRAILLGASNLRRSLPLVLGLLRRRAGGPIEALAACGHGRSYGAWSRFLGVRRLPAIAGCGLWRELGRRPPLPTFALVADVGNDLVYGAGVEAIAGWVEACLDRLILHSGDHPLEIVMALLPLARLERLSAGQVRLAASLLFPGREAPWPALLDRARELDGRLRRLGGDRNRGVRLVEPEASWYGIDPIHLRRRVRREVWTRIVAPGSAGTGPPAGRVPIPLLGAAEVRLFGVPVRRSQPAVRLRDGTTVSLY